MENLLERSALRKFSFALIDPALADLIPASVTSQALTPRRLSQGRHLMPSLIDLRPLSEDGLTSLYISLQECAEYTSEPLIRFLVATDTNAEEFSRHWNLMQMAQQSPNCQDPPGYRPVS